MKKEEVLSRLKEIITERLDVEEDQIIPETTFVEDLKLRDRKSVV